jgi:hypothetical protein
MDALPPGGGRTTAMRPAGRDQHAGRYRLTLSQPLAADADLPLTLTLKRSDELLSAIAPPRSYGPEDMERLRVESRVRMSADPIGEAANMQLRLGALETGLAGMKTQLAEISAARRAAEDRARRLEAENRRLSDTLRSAGIAAAFVVCALLGALAFWRYRVSSEVRARREHEWNRAAPGSVDDDITPARAPGANAARAMREQRADDFEGADAAAGDADYERTVVLHASPAPMAPVDSTAHPATPGGTSAPQEPLYLPESAIGHAAPKSDSGHAAPKSAIEYAAADSATDHAPPELPPASPDSASPPLMPVYAGASPARPPHPASTVAALTGPHTPLNFSLEEPAPGAAPPSSDPAEAATRERYLAEFERKLFPEIALGRVKLNEPRSIIALARTYYQEDFDPGKAISFLEYSLFRSADPMLIHLALLEVLRMERRAGEYATVARAFRAQYPDNTTHWQLIAAYGRLLDARDPMYVGETIPGMDLDTPSNWLGSTLDMTKYVLGQKVSDSVRDLPAMQEGEGA